VTVLHVQANDPSSLLTGHLPGLISRRVMTRVADYLYAAPGLPGVVMAEFESEAEATKAAETLEAPEAVVNVFNQLSPATGWLEASGIHDGPQRPCGTTVLSVIMDVQPHALEDFHGWYDEEHLPKLVAVPGILAAVRYQTSTGPRFLAWYEFADESVVASQAFADASVLTPRTAAVTAHLEWASQLYVDRTPT
jgi:hypothetical protein